MVEIRSVGRKQRAGTIARSWYRDVTARMRSLHIRWHHLCDQYLPLVSDDGLWRFSRAPGEDDPDQGWKLHISATILSAGTLLSKVAPLLSQLDTLFKVPASLEELNHLNSGIKYGYSQVGKCLTVYPQTTEQAVTLAGQLHSLTRRFPGPDVPFDELYQSSSRVSYRYGAFHSARTIEVDGKAKPAIRGPEGRLIADLRKPGTAVPDWTTSPFPKANSCQPHSGRLRDTSGLSVRAYEAISQKGKGGVYRAVDLSVSPPQLCLLKEGRRHGETAWDGRDGFWRIQHEAYVLKDLARSGVPVPQVYRTFVSDSHFYLTMEMLEGCTLQYLLKSQPDGMPLSQALRYAMQIAELVNSIHLSGWVWRDCKPANFIRTPDGQLHPIDFEGACKVSDLDPAAWGTTGYVAPEALRELPTASRLPEDLYSLGSVLHHLLVGQKPAQNPLEGIPRKLPKSIREIIRALLDPLPAGRPAGSEVLRLLAATRQG